MFKRFIFSQDMVSTRAQVLRGREKSTGTVPHFPFSIPSLMLLERVIYNVILLIVKLDVFQKRAREVRRLVQREAYHLARLQLSREKVLLQGNHEWRRLLRSKR